MTNLQLSSKACSRCKKNLPISEFFKDKHSPSGFTYRCKTCFNSRKKYTYKQKNIIVDQPDEIWADVVGYEGLYLVSNFGRVKSIERYIEHSKDLKVKRKAVLLKTPPNQDGYLHCNLSNNKVTKTYKIHLLVWDAFGKEKRNGRIIVVDHKDNDKNNNRFDNLQLLPHRVNTIKDRKLEKLLGANLNRSTGKWYAQIRINKKVNRIGSFDTQLQAHQAYMKAIIDVETGKGLTNVTKKMRVKQSKYIGVSLTGSNRWRSMINFNNKRTHLGVFTTEEEAAQAYQTALNQLQNKAA